MKFDWAIQKLKEGKKIRRKSWKTDSFWCAKGKEIINKRSSICTITMSLIYANDWELFGDENNFKGFEHKCICHWSKDDKYGFIPDVNCPVHGKQTKKMLSKSVPYEDEKEEINRIIKKAVKGPKPLTKKEREFFDKWYKKEFGKNEESLRDEEFLRNKAEGIIAMSSNNQKESLSEGSRMGANALPLNEPFILTKDVKEKIQEAEKRLKEEMYKLYPMERHKDILNKIFLEEFGEKLI